MTNDLATLYLAATEALAHEEFQAAFDGFSSVLNVNPDHNDAILGKGVALLKLGHLTEAIACLNAVTNKSRALYWAGIAYFYLEDFARAESSFMAIPNDSRTSLWLVKCRAELKRLSPAPADDFSSFQHVTAGKVAYFWNQDNSRVTLRVPVPARKDVQVKIGERELSIIASKLDGAEFHFALDLFDKVDKGSSSWSLKDGTVEVSLIKVAQVTWASLEYKGDATRASYPTSSKVKKDWSKIDRQCDAELRTDKDEGEGALNKFFQEIYSNANEDTRRAMIKSFQTSGGTVLSTNWSEVGTADYEGKDRPEAPAGQQWQK